MSESYDYIIAGGGLSGLVLATRLSEDASNDVLVIEAGDDQTSDPRVNVPGMWPTLVGTESTWNFKTVPQPGLEGREIGFPQGRLLGGSSALNGLTFSATSKANIDAWERLGNPGWGWSHFSESMKRAYTLSSGEAEPSGPIQLTIPEADTEWPRIWKETLASLGYQTESDPFNGEFLGGAVIADAVDPLTKQRSYAANAYLAPARSRPNLTVWTNTQVEKVLFDTDKSDSIIATGVEVKQQNETKFVGARREVVISAGAINSPKLLELSGIGDAKLLRSLGIEVVIDNPHVGENLQNHPLCTVSFQAHDKPGFGTLDSLARQEGDAISAAMEAYAKQAGPFSRSGTNLAAQLPTPGLGSDDAVMKLVSLQSDQEELESFQRFHEAFVGSLLTTPTEATACYAAIPGFAGLAGDGSMAPPPQGQDNYFSMLLILAHPLSRGSAHITGPSSSSVPDIDPKYLTHPLDIEVMARHLQLVEKIATTQPLGSLLNPHSKCSTAGPIESSFADLNAAKSYLRKTAVGAHHFTGTCSMMPKDMGGVVDAELCVYGCQNLRVCDASIIPITPRTNAQATVYGLAEHGARIILGY